MTTKLGLAQPPSFYSFNFENDDVIDFDRNKIGTKVEIVELGIPCFDNIGEHFDTCKLIGDHMGMPFHFNLATGCYTNGDDLATALTTLTTLTWTFDSITKRMGVTDALPFSFLKSKLTQLILGFDDDNHGGPTTSIVANNSLNLFPFSHYVLKSGYLPQRSFIPGGRVAVVTINISTFDFITTTRVLFNKDDFRSELLTFSDNFFPASFSLWVYFLDGSFYQAPLKQNLKVNMMIKLS